MTAPNHPTSRGRAPAAQGESTSAAGESPGEDVRVRPDGKAWQAAQQAVADRNDQARKAGREVRKDRERREAALRKASEDRGAVYR